MNEALRLANFLEMHWCGVDMPEAKAAAELRRLHAENESLRQIVHDFPPVEAELREVSDRAHRLEAQRDALLEALKTVLAAGRGTSGRIILEAADEAAARAAIRGGGRGEEMSTNTGGPAFPVNNEALLRERGMTLRDYFAAKAMQGLCAGNSTNAKEIAGAAYIISDAMLKAREA